MEKVFMKFITWVLRLSERLSTAGKQTFQP